MLVGRDLNLKYELWVKMNKSGYFLHILSIMFYCVEGDLVPNVVTRFKTKAGYKYTGDDHVT